MKTDSLEDLKTLDYAVRIEYDREDAVYIADFVDLPGCSATGPTVSEAYRRAQRAKEEWFRVTLEQGLPIPKPSTPGEYSGRLLLRVPASLHSMLAERARANGASLNQYMVHLLSAGTVAEEMNSKIEVFARGIQGTQRPLAAKHSEGQFRSRATRRLSTPKR
ncbi:MAG: type II toxin-antitoxin system HicB family antitoxin [Bryobacteraceae bacterium]|jgi:antitoxin HicB